MLSAVKMEGHEHPDWSSSYYYAEPEVREFHRVISQWGRWLIG